MKYAVRVDIGSISYYVNIFKYLEEMYVLTTYEHRQLYSLYEADNVCRAAFKIYGSAAKEIAPHTREETHRINLGENAV